MDNHRIHHRGRIQEICEANHVLLIYLPPYSPDFNPIEKVFSVLKSCLKRAQILNGNWGDAELIKNFLPTFVTPGLMRSLYSSCGYSWFLLFLIFNCMISLRIYCFIFLISEVFPIFFSLTS
ncbi:hypothetical protein PGTUg99_050020 [Puccinia graminis f. sp. tritici]|uniref:Tc1-like transposase DDE domain-containing protein n=1 Tax=Puccinia graminis f. sp. tritici TaxID=56615 RepID=A0A5B0MDG0_PUCGR|nr:hypothetical protein PGTUg99_050020 [Puccinia graminis f. sp. tritici]